MSAKRMLLTVLAAGAVLLAGLLAPLAIAREGAPKTEWISPAAWPRLSQEFRISNPTSPECPRYFPAVAYNWVQREYLVVWHNWWSSTYQDIYARRVTGSGELESWFAVAAGGNSRSHPSVAYNASAGEYLVVYMYDAKGDGIHWEVWGRRVAWNGAWLGPEFQIFTWANRSFTSPRVVWNSYRNEYLVVANAVDTTTDRYNDVAGRRVMADGSTPYPGHNISSQSQTLQPQQADVTYNLAADEYLVVWRRNYSGDDWDIWGARVRGDNDAVVTPPGEFVINQYIENQALPAIATNEQDRYLVVWMHGVGIPTTSWIIRGQELDTSGNPVGDMLTLSIYPLENEQDPDVAINGGANLPLVIYQRSASGGYEIWAQRPLHPPDWGTTLAHLVSTGASGIIPPAVASGPPGYLVVYGKIEGTTALHIWGQLYWPEGVFLPVILK